MTKQILMIGFVKYKCKLCKRYFLSRLTGYDPDKIVLSKNVMWHDTTCFLQ